MRTHLENSAALIPDDGVDTRPRIDTKGLAKVGQTFRRRKVLTLVAWVAAVTLVSWVVKTRLLPTTSRSGGTIQAVPLRLADIVATIEATGTVEPEEVVDVGAQVAGQIISFGKDKNGKPIDYGSVVEEGTVLAQIDDSLYAADLAQARAQLTQTRANLLSAEANVMQMIELMDIRKTYHMGELDLPVLKGVTVRIHRGEMVALMGASGSGKTTLMNILGCLDHPTSGRYWLDESDVTHYTAKERAGLRNRLIGFVFQSFILLPRTSALENVMMPLAYSRDEISEVEMSRRAKELLAKVGLSDRLDHQPSQLSGGQQQRVAIARSLVNRPKVLMADEPTGNLDSSTSEEILQMFTELNRTEGITLILVTHDATVAGHAQRIIRIRDGLIEGDGSATPRSGTAVPESAGGAT